MAEDKAHHDVVRIAVQLLPLAIDFCFPLRVERGTGRGAVERRAVGSERLGARSAARVQARFKNHWPSWAARREMAAVAAPAEPVGLRSLSEIAVRSYYC